MPRLLVCILTCHQLDYFVSDSNRDYLDGIRGTDLEGRRKACRDTWITRLGDIEYRFFFGSTLRNGQKVQRQPLEDEVFLDCGDSYTSNSDKLKAICQWALERGYDYILKVDDDTFLYPERLFAEDWQHDYAGALPPQCNFHPGSAVFLNNAAMLIIANARVTNWADDVWVGKLLADHGIQPHGISSLSIKFGDDYLTDPDKLPENVSGTHSCTPDVMRELYRREYSVLST